MAEVSTVARVPPMNCGDVFVIDNGRSLGITVKDKGAKTFEQICKEWDEGEAEKDFPFGDHQTVTFFNGKGADALESWLQTRPKKDV